MGIAVKELSKSKLFVPKDISKQKVNDDYVILSPEMEAKLERAMKQIENGEYTVISSEEELHQFFENL
jgi:hypothetical protein